MSGVDAEDAVAVRRSVAADGRGAGDGRGASRRDRGDVEPCLRCGVPLPVRLMGCKGGHCPNCGHPYPHGDCSD